jgi:hypothetical protein
VTGGTVQPMAFLGPIPQDGGSCHRFDAPADPWDSAVIAVDVSPALLAQRTAKAERVPPREAPSLAGVPGCRAPRSRFGPPARHGALDGHSAENPEAIRGL